MKLLVISDNIYEENSYLVVIDKLLTIIDPGYNFNKIDSYIIENNLKVSKILLTHGHFDHVGETEKILKKYGNLPIYISELDIPLLFDTKKNLSESKNVVLKESDDIRAVKDKDEVDGFIFYHTPGHTIGSSVIEYKNFLFTGDTLFKGSIGRTDLPTGKMSDLNRSLKMIMTSFSKSTIILPGHYSKTTLEDEIKNNQFLKQIKKEK